MKLKIIKIHNKGNETEEYVFLQALEDCDVGDYALADATYTEDGGLSNKCRHFFWFPDKKIKKGEYVSVRTGQGTNTTKKTNKGIPIHRFYWGLDKAVWNDDGDFAVLYFIENFKSHKVKDAS